MPMPMPVRPLLNLLSPAGPRARLSVLIFHRVVPEPDPIFPGEMHAARFDQICAWLKQWFNVLPLDQAAQQLRYGRLPERACCITFDDGYADNLHIAVPILRKHGLTAAFFIATGFLDGGRMWNDTVIEAIRHCRASRLDLDGLGEFELNGPKSRSKAIAALLDKIKYLPISERIEQAGRIAETAGVDPDEHLMMSSDEVRQMRQAGMQIGAHTLTHPILATLPAAEARREMQLSQLFLQDLLKERIGLFAYPNGKPGRDYLPEHAQIAQDLGFDAAVSTAWGAADANTDGFQIPRFTPWDSSRARFGMRLVQNLVRRGGTITSASQPMGPSP
ncbi:polysaccharide deacetylase family protein [Pelomonas sp. KK5]|uniref:polysaccharide deacetylase family protein n=1 Tax=Pelomonas sp. KK5 TaxID=1855730 RepID=UPI001E4782E4|nr:polysaccharide deacetylase family protein [Pelomonas sp. KK5]